MLAITIVEGVALFLLALLVVGLLRSHAEILRSLHDLGADDELDARQGPGLVQRRAGDLGAAHNIDGVTLDGEAVAIGVVGATHDTLLAFLSAGCYTCEPFWKALSGSVEVPNRARVIAIVQAGDNAPKLRRLAGPDLLAVMSDAAWSDYDVPGSPHFVYVDGPSGRVAGEGTASTWEQVKDLLEQAAGVAGQAPSDSINLIPPARDNAERIDLELHAAAIGPGHDSLYPDRKPPTAGRTDTADH